jgi:hypothetical protein
LKQRLRVEKLTQPIVPLNLESANRIAKWQGELRQLFLTIFVSVDAGFGSLEGVVGLDSIVRELNAGPFQDDNKKRKQEQIPCGMTKRK